METPPHPTVLALPLMARRLRIPMQALRAAAEAGDIPCVRVGGALMFEPAAVEKVIAERATGAKGGGR